MSDTIKPALTPEEWHERAFDSCYGTTKTLLQVDHKGRVSVQDDDACVVLNEAVDAAIVLPKIAALALHGQPFGFTREDMRELEFLVEAASREWGSDGDEVKFLRSLADRIAALLPPE